MKTSNQRRYDARCQADGCEAQLVCVRQKRRNDCGVLVDAGWSMTKNTPHTCPIEPKVSPTTKMIIDLITEQKVNNLSSKDVRHLLEIHRYQADNRMIQRALDVVRDLHHGTVEDNYAKLPSLLEQ